jgi:DNA replication protein DnaC
VTATHQLEATLRSLKLSGMLDTLEAPGSPKPGAGELGHLEFLQVLCEDEASRRGSHRHQPADERRPVRRASQPGEFDFTISAKLPVATLHDLATLRFLDRGESVVLHGPVGIGKTTDAQADDLYELITERTGRSTICTPNRVPTDWYPLFPTPVVAESLLERLINTSHVVLMDDPSYRPRKRPTRV